MTTTMHNVVDQGRALLRIVMYTSALLAIILCGAVFTAIVCDTTLRKRRRREGERKHGQSAIYVGKVWHARFKPAAHRFAYPLFYCLVDLDDIKTTFPWYMWPVASACWPALSQLRACDHLKSVGAGGAAEENQTKRKVSELAGRIRDIVEDATGKRPEGRIQLLTHLAYLGYCFNPVSFYYCMDESGRGIESVVGEVSNTPWGEMHCYVLSPKSKGVEVLTGECSTAVRYRFKKDFHVSPFMSMEHLYDWRFTAPVAELGSGLTAQTTMLEPGSDGGKGGGAGGKVFFDAKLVLERREWTAASLAWHMAVYPIFTVWVQLLIHFEAFRLWMKQVPYFPHPTGYETSASRLIGAIMKPFFDAQEAWASRRTRNSDPGDADGRKDR